MNAIRLKRIMKRNSGQFDLQARVKYILAVPLIYVFILFFSSLYNQGYFDLLVWVSVQQYDLYEIMFFLWEIFRSSAMLLSYHHQCLSIYRVVWNKMKSIFALQL